eukprot:m51a1_g2754 putative C-tail anchored protein (336) ;mRNA; r:966569-967576
MTATCAPLLALVAASLCAAAAGLAHDLDNRSSSSPYSSGSEVGSASSSTSGTSSSSSSDNGVVEPPPLPTLLQARVRTTFAGVGTREDLVWAVPGVGVRWTETTAGAGVAVRTAVDMSALLAVGSQIRISVNRQRQCDQSLSPASGGTLYALLMRSNPLFGFGQLCTWERQTDTAAYGRPVVRLSGQCASATRAVRARALQRREDDGVSSNYTLFFESGLVQQGGVLLGGSVAVNSLAGDTMTGPIEVLEWASVANATALQMRLCNVSSDESSSPSTGASVDVASAAEGSRGLRAGVIVGLFVAALAGVTVVAGSGLYLWWHQPRGFRRLDSEVC